MKELQFLLKALACHGEEPMEDGALKDALSLRFRCPAGDVALVIARAQELGLIVGTSDDVLGTVWALTQRGQTKAAQLMTR